MEQFNVRDRWGFYLFVSAYMNFLDSHFILSATLKFLQVTFRILKLVQILVKFETLKMCLFILNGDFVFLNIK